MTKKITQAAFFISLLLVCLCLFSQSLAAGTCNNGKQPEQKARPVTDELTISPFSMLLS